MKLNTIACSAAISLALIGTASAHYKSRESAAQEQQETAQLNSQHNMDVADANTITGSDIKAAGGVTAATGPSNTPEPKNDFTSGRANAASNRNGAPDADAPIGAAPSSSLGK